MIKKTLRKNFIDMLKKEAMSLKASPTKQRRSDGRILYDFACLVGDYLPNVVEYSLTEKGYIKLDILNKYLKNLNVYTFALNRPTMISNNDNEYTNIVVVKRTFKANVKIKTECIKNRIVNLELIKECLNNGTATITKELSL